MRDTGYYIQKGYIYGPSGFTNTYIDNDNQIYSYNGGTGYYLQNDYIYGPSGYSSFYLYKYGIYGPAETLPWIY